MKIRFVPQGIEVELNSDKSVLQVAHENGIPIRSVCKGVPSCAECRVKVVEGEDNVLPPTKAEINLVGSTYFVDQRRLSCQLRCFGDVTIDVSDHIGREETGTKKLRGVKHSSLPQETRAVQGTIMLEDPGPQNWDDTEEDGNEEDSAGSSRRVGDQGPRNDSGGGQQQRRRRKKSRRGPQASGGGENSSSTNAGHQPGGSAKKKSRNNRRGNRRRSPGKGSPSPKS